MTTTLRHSKYWREYVADEFAAASLTPATVDMMVAAEAISLHISNSEWLELRVAARAGINLHASEGRGLHGVEASIRPQRMFEATLGERGRWEW